MATKTITKKEHIAQHTQIKKSTAPVEKIEDKKEKKKVKKNFETVKTVTIAVLITGIVAFILGMQYQAREDSTVKAEAASIVKSVKVDVQQVPVK